MSKPLRIALAAVGIVLVVGAAIIKWVVAPALVKIPLDVSVTTVADGRSQVFVLTAQAVRSVDVIATRTVKGDKSAGTDSVAVWDETLCLVAKGTRTDSAGCASATQPGFIQKTTDRIAFDRKSALAVPSGAKYGANVNGDKSVRHVGLGYTFPIDTKKRTYQFFDPIAGKAFPARYSGTATIHGVDVYRFVSEVTSTPIKIQSLLPGTYSGQTIVWVEPTTGVIVKGSQRIVQKFSSNGHTVFNGTLTFTDATQGHQADYADSQRNKVQLIRVWVPIGSAVLGLVLILLAVLVRRRRGTVETGQSNGPEAAGMEPSSQT